jgi:ribosome-associated heat shock protein Hsp15
MDVRLDKWLQVARVFKTRSAATHACTLGRVRVNGATAKPHRHLQTGDQIEVDLRHWTRLLVVQELHDRPLPKAQAARLYEDRSPPPPVLDPLARLLRRPPVERERGKGRPTKRERREQERFTRND